MHHASITNTREHVWAANFDKVRDHVERCTQKSRRGTIMEKLMESMPHIQLWRIMEQLKTSCFKILFKHQMVRNLFLLPYYSLAFVFCIT